MNNQILTNTLSGIKKENETEDIEIMNQWINTILGPQFYSKAAHIREVHLKQIIQMAILLKTTVDDRARIFDMASGSAESLIEILDRNREFDIHAFCRDINKRWIRRAAKNARKLRLANIDFQISDPFSAGNFQKLPFQPNIIISSSFFEGVFKESDIKSIIQRIYDCLPEEGYFVYSFLSEHIDINWINTLFSDLNLVREPRHRDQFEVWLKEVGFSIQNSLVDDWGYYNVGMVQK